MNGGGRGVNKEGWERFEEFEKCGGGGGVDFLENLVNGEGGV